MAVRSLFGSSTNSSLRTFGPTRSLLRPSRALTEINEGQQEGKFGLMRRSPVVLAGAGFVVILLLATACLGPRHRSSETRTGGPETASPTPQIPAITGVEPSPVPVSDAWQIYENPTIGLEFRYPPAWQLHADPDQSATTVYPPGVDPNLPGPGITFTFAREHRFSDGPLKTTWVTQPQSLAVAGATGRWYEDTAFAVPSNGYYVEVPHRTGTLFISATKGPSVSLIPQLQEILTTVRLHE